jgi:hypothetical protein
MMAKIIRFAREKRGAVRDWFFSLLCKCFIRFLVYLTATLKTLLACLWFRYEYGGYVIRCQFLLLRVSARESQVTGLARSLIQWTLVEVVLASIIGC